MHFLHLGFSEHAARLVNMLGEGGPLIIYFDLLLGLEFDGRQHSGTTLSTRQLMLSAYMLPFMT